MAYGQRGCYFSYFSYFSYFVSIKRIACGAWHTVREAVVIVLRQESVQELEGGRKDWCAMAKAPENTIKNDIKTE